MANILIIDDDKSFCNMVCRFAKKEHYSATYALTLKDGLSQLASETFDVVFLDVGLPDGNGLDIIPEIKTSPSAPEVVIITGKGESAGAEMAIKNGAWDYLNKPFSLSKIGLQLNGIIKYRREKQQKASPVALIKDGIIGSSNELKKSLDLLQDAAKSDANVLITGETGTGKELFARAIHKNSRRASGSFVVVDCGSLTESLVGSILFGHSRGAFTGASSKHIGLIKQAHKGTLFLDEAGELPLSIQATLLRVLQEHRIRPLGGSAEEESDFRLITATNRDMDLWASQGKIREDLLYRLKTISIELPPLRSRKSDIKELVTYYINMFCERYQYGMKRYTPEFMDILTAYHWPGNVRELSSAMELAVCSAQSDDLLFPIHLPPHIRIKTLQSSIGDSNAIEETAPPDMLDPSSFVDLKSFLQINEKRYLKNLVTMTGGDVKAICRISGLSRSRLYQRLKEYAIDRKTTLS